MTAGAIQRLHGAAVHPFGLRAGDAERLAGQIEVEPHLPRIDRAVEVQHFAQVAVRMEAIAIADQVALRRHAVDRGADHQERPVELPAVEGDEAVVAVEELPELLQDLLLGAGDHRAVAVLARDDFRLPGHLVHRAGAAGLGVDDADGDDLAGERRERAAALLFLRLGLVHPLDQVLTDVGVVLLPRQCRRSRCR